MELPDAGVDFTSFICSHSDFSAQASNTQNQDRTHHTRQNEANKTNNNAYAVTIKH